MSVYLKNRIHSYGKCGSYSTLMDGVTLILPAILEESAAVFSGLGYKQHCLCCFHSSSPLFVQALTQVGLFCIKKISVCFQNQSIKLGQKCHKNAWLGVTKFLLSKLSWQSFIALGPHSRDVQGLGDAFPCTWQLLIWIFLLCLLLCQKVIKAAEMTLFTENFCGARKWTALWNYCVLKIFLRISELCSLTSSYSELSAKGK